MVRFLTVVLCCVSLQCFLPATPFPADREPIVVITFDDGDPSIYTFAFPLMRLYNPDWAATHFLPGSYTESPGSVTVPQLREMEAAGWETGGHGIVHENLSSVPLDSAEKQIKGSYDFLVKNGLSHESYAFAYGNYNADITSIALSYFKNIRTAHDLYYADGVNRSELGYFAVKSTHSVQDIVARVELARAKGYPLVVIGFHLVLPDTSAGSPYYWCKESTFKGFLDYCKKEEFSIMTIKNAMKQLQKE